MISDIHIKEYVEQAYPNAKGLSYKRIEFPLTDIKIYETTIDKPFEQFNQADFVDLFEKNNWTAKNTFASNKSIVRDFASWYFENVIGLDNIPFGHPKVSPIEHIEYSDISSDERYRREYFKDYDSFFECLEEMFGPITEDQYVMHKVFFVLMWEGVNRGELRFLKHEDIEYDAKPVVIHFPDRNVLVQEQRSIEIIRNAIEATDYEIVRKNGRHKPYTYAPTKMLLRNTSKKLVDDYDMVSESTINNYYTDQLKMAKELPASDEYHFKRLVFRGISDSAAFTRLQQEGKTSRVSAEEIAKARKVVAVPKTIEASFNSNYKGWREFFGY